MISLILSFEKRSEDWHKRVADLHNINYTHQDIADNLRVSVELVRHSIEIHRITTTWYDVPGTIGFGHKDQAYYTEKEAIKGYKPPKYSDLSPDEKAIYNL
jgi:hypothetical protein